MADYLGKFFSMKPVSGWKAELTCFYAPLETLHPSIKSKMFLPRYKK